LLLVMHPALARPITVAAPAGAAAELIGVLVRRFEEQSGREVRLSPLAMNELARTARDGGADAFLVPSRIDLGTGARPVERAPVFASDAVLVGSRADRARVRGQRDIRTAFRWIAGARALTAASSPQLGLRGLELSLWDAVGVDIRSRTTWYEPGGEGDENAAFARAAASGSYALIERMTFAAQRDRRGLEVITGGDPLLVTRWESLLLSPDPGPRAWHDWLRSDAGRGAIREAQINGVAPLAPVTTEPATTADPVPRRAPDPS
jgi:tungstate transport system substrate-binding protein